MKDSPRVGIRKRDEATGDETVAFGFFMYQVFLTQMGISLFRTDHVYHDYFDLS